jgi:hypothetical protein
VNFNDHSKLTGKHAFLGASQYSWINYDEQKVVDTYMGYLAREKGTILHSFAAQCILLGQKLPRSKKTLNMYVNDAIGYQMTPEQILYFSDNCFGTADAISFRVGVLRIHDYKSGVVAAHMEQLEIYAALFCLEYRIKPKDISIELRIYQSDDIVSFEPDPEEIMIIVNKIISFDEVLTKIKSEGE